MLQFIAENSAEAYVLYRELDYFEQFGTLERHSGFDFELIQDPARPPPDRPVGDVAAVHRRGRGDGRLPELRAARDQDAHRAVMAALARRADHSA
jgi:hypothetical protein